MRGKTITMNPSRARRQLCASATILVGGMLLASLACPRPAFAQAVGEVATRAAEDAFGAGVEGDVIGLYDIDDARGASPLEAGNVRIEGLYALAGEPTDRLSDKSRVAVGIRTLDETHAAPSGVVGFFLRRVEEESFVSSAAAVGDRFSSEASLDLGWRGDGPVSLVGGAGASVLRRDDFGDDDWEFEAAGAAHWESAAFDASAFLAHERGWDLEEPILYESQDGAPPPRVSRRRSYHQPFVGNDEESWLLGALVSAPLPGAMRLKGGVFFDTSSHDGAMLESFEIDDAGSGGEGRRIVTAFAPSRGESLSGELRLERMMSGSALEGVLFATLRGRSERNREGGMAEAALDDAVVPINFRSVEPRPDFVFEPGNRESVDQQLAGLGARLTWRERLEVNLGIQHSWYRQRVREDGGGSGVGASDRRMLGNVGAAFRIAPGLRVYAGYVRGLEELGAAPFTAANANVALAAATATQSDVALEWRPNQTLTLIVGAFDLRRPFADLDENDMFGIRGEERTRGVELSAVWRPDEDFNVILGVVSQRPRLHGEAFPRGTRAPAQPSQRFLLEADAAVPGAPGLFFTLSAAHERGVRTNAENVFRLAPQTVIDVGLRYEFAAGETPMQIELSVENATDEFSWRADGSDGFTLNDPRTVALSVTADF